tara:strand:+ start:268 stop:408 length:141 start_codon:yes stop_codon:yes gene_type:complete
MLTNEQGWRLQQLLWLLDHDRELTTAEIKELLALESQIPEEDLHPF